MKVSLFVLSIFLTISWCQDLVAHYNFNEDPSDLILNDQSNNFYHGSYIAKNSILSRSRPLGGDILNKVILFQTFFPLNESQIIFPTMAIIRNELTIAFIYEPRDTKDQTIFSLKFANNKYIKSYLKEDFMVLNFFDEKTVTLDYNFETTALYQLVFVLTTNKMTIYANGEEIKYFESSTNYNFGYSLTIRLGYSEGESSVCTALFDELLIWNNAFDYDEVQALLDKLAFGLVEECEGRTEISGPLFDICDGKNSTNNSGKSQISPCNWSSTIKSRGVDCFETNQNEVRFAGRNGDPYMFRYLSLPTGASYISFSFRFLDLCRTDDPNENMEDFAGNCRLYGKYMILSLCAFNNYCLNIGIDTYGQRFFHNDGYSYYSIRNLLEFGRVERPMKDTYPTGPLIIFELYPDQTIWIYIENDDGTLEGLVQGYRVNLPLPFEYFNLLRILTTSSSGEVGAVFSEFSFYSENFNRNPEECPENTFYNGYECQSCGLNSYSPPGSIGSESCVCQYGFFSDNCRSSPLCLGNNPGFSFRTMDNSLLQYIGSATLSETLAVLTPNRNEQSGGVFFSQPWNLIDFSSDEYPEISFSTHFAFVISNSNGKFPSSDPGGDGFAFIMSSSIPTELPMGGSLGYAKLRNSIAIEFDTFKNNEYSDISSSHVGINIDGVMISSSSADTPKSLKNGQVWHCWVDYDATYGTLTVKLSETNVEPEESLLEYSIEVENIIRSTQMYIGFTAATGGQYSKHTIIRWDFETKPQLSCSPCPYDTYKPFPGNEECYPCPVGSSTFTLGAIEMYECQCYPGLYMEEFGCSECPINTTSSYGQVECTPCPEKSNTLGLRGQIACTCEDGYYLDFDQKCKDYNECYDESRCFNGGTCINIDGSYSCKCLPGYRGQQCEIDVNECLNEVCFNGGTCVNVPGSYACKCPPGWHGNNCLEDINECDSSPCHEKAQCYNTIGSFVCKCNVGLIGNGIECIVPKGPTLLPPGNVDIYPRYVRISWIPENFFNVSSYVLEIDYTEQTGSSFAPDEKREFISSQNEAIIENLTPNQNLMIRLTAVNEIVTSPPSNIVQFRTKATAADPPVLSVERGLDGYSLNLKWIPGRPNGSNVTQYIVMWAETDDKNTTVTESISASQTWLELKNLLPGIFYTFTVTAKTLQYGYSDPSNAVTASVTGIPIPIDPTESPSSSPVTKSNGAMIAGIVIGVIVFFIVAVGSVLYYQRHRMQGRIKLPDSGSRSVGLLNPIDDSLNVPDAFSAEEEEEDAIEK